MNVLLGICGSIAAYKSLELIRLLKKNSADVKIILTKSALNFITPLSCQTLSGNEVFIDQFVLTRGIKHLTLADWADILVVAPATANIIGKAARGIGDDLLSTTLLSFQKNILYVPAMDTGMWDNRIVRENVQRLKGFDSIFLEPQTGPLASGKIGRGRFPSVYAVFKKILTIIEGRKPLTGTRVLISGGRTEEDIDSVRVVTNRSSGRMASELYWAAVCRDAEVKGIIGETTVNFPEEPDIIRVRTSQEMLDCLEKETDWCDILIMAAAVGDYKPASKSRNKIHDRSMSLGLVKNVDIVKQLTKKKGSRIIVGFSLEDKNSIKRGTIKLKGKGLDLCVLNKTNALGQPESEVQILDVEGRVSKFGMVTKWETANRILDLCLKKVLRKHTK